MSLSIDVWTECSSCEYGSAYTHSVRYSQGAEAPIFIHGPYQLPDADTDSVADSEELPRSYHHEGGFGEIIGFGEIVLSWTWAQSIGFQTICRQVYIYRWGQLKLTNPSRSKMRAYKSSNRQHASSMSKHWLEKTLLGVTSRPLGSRRLFGEILGNCTSLADT
jgi:hypothetical protein